MRAVAVLLVVAYHTGAVGVAGGYVGVDVFFVISGFLITNHLVAQILDTGRLSFAEFYAKRARRILPASFTVLLFTLLAIVLFTPPLLRPREFWDAIWTALYVPNMAFAVQGTNYLSETAPSAFQHYWSLGIEEQFYLLWPAVLILLWLLVGRSRKRATVAVFALVVASLVLGVVLTQYSQPWAFFGLPARAWELGVGGLIALVGPAAANRCAPWIRIVGGWLGLLAILATAIAFDSTVAFPGYAALLPVAGAAALIFFGQSPVRGSPSTMLSVRPLTFIGEISYSMYLVHWPILTIAAVSQMGQLSATHAIGLGLLSIPVAWLLYRFVENPMRTWEWLRKRKPRWTLAVFASATGLTIALSFAGLAMASDVPLDSGRPGPAAPTATIHPEFTKFVPKNMAPSLNDVADDIPVLYNDGCHLAVPESQVQDCAYGDLDSPTVVALFGDSHAAQWFPAMEKLALEKNFRLETYTKSACPTVDVPIYLKNVLYRECGTWRERVIAHFIDAPPAAIVISNLANSPGQPYGTITEGGWADGLATVINRLPAQSEVISITDTPRMSGTPAICLSQNLTDADKCSALRTESIDQGWNQYIAKAASDSGAKVIDLNDFICDERRCGAIIGSTLVYRDGSHLTATFVGTLSDRLWDGLRTWIELGPYSAN